MKTCSNLPKLFITDLDGTALGGGYRPYSKFPDAFSAFLDRLDRGGCKWATNTTWDVGSQVNLICASPLLSRPVYLMGGVGLQLCSLGKGEPQKVQPYCDKMDEKLQTYLKTIMQPFFCDICGRFPAKSASYSGHWFSMRTLPEKASAMISYLSDKYLRVDGLTIEIVSEEDRFYSFPSFLGKGVCAREIIKLMGLTPYEVVVAGDEKMDLEMMDPEIAAHAICPDNALAEVKDRVLAMNGAVGRKGFGPGVIEAFEALAERNGWQW